MSEGRTSWKPNRPRGAACGLEPVWLCPHGARDVRAGRTGAAGPADGTDSGRNGLAVPALRCVRDRRAARQRSGRGGATPPPGQGTAQRADPARVRGGAVPPLCDLGRRGLRGVAVQVRPGRHPAGVQQRPAGHPCPVPGSRLQRQRLQAARADPGVVQVHLTLAHLPGHRAGCLRCDRAGGKRWGEYFAMVATSIFLPYEVYDLTVKITGLRVAALVINLLLVIYLAWTKRLFGIRGGQKAYEARLRTESVIEVEQAAFAAASPGQPGHGKPAGAAVQPASDAPGSAPAPSAPSHPRLTPPHSSDPPN